jgi:hypothetical protein
MLHCERCERGRLYSTAKPSLLLIVLRIPRRAWRESLARYRLYFVGYVTIMQSGKNTDPTRRGMWEGHSAEPAARSGPWG